MWCCIISDFARGWFEELNKDAYSFKTRVGNFSTLLYVELRNLDFFLVDFNELNTMILSYSRKARLGDFFNIISLGIALPHLRRSAKFILLIVALFRILT